MGSVIISRKLPGGEIGFAVFLLDVFCLGVKDAFFSVRPQGEYESAIGEIRAREDLKPIEPTCAVKLIEAAAAYARELGLNPQADYLFAKRIFGNIDSAACSQEFTFGKDGKPFYMAGSHEPEAESRRIMDILTKKLGPDGFHYLLPVDFEDE
jgi:hypothetical protein